MREATTIAAIFAGKPTKVQFIQPNEYRVSVAGQEEQSVITTYLKEATDLVDKAYENGVRVGLSMHPDGVIAQVDDAELKAQLIGYRTVLLQPLLEPWQKRLPPEMRNAQL